MPTENEVAARIVADVAVKPLDVRVGGTSITQSSGGYFAHVGVSTAFGGFVVLSAEVPLVLSEAVTLSSPQLGYPTGAVAPAPEPGDVGDMKAGFSVWLPHDWRPAWWRVHHTNLSIAGDFWAGTGDSQMLTGAPASHFRFMATVDGEIPVGHSTVVPRLEYAAAVGYQQLFSSVGDVGVAEGVPMRVALGATVIPCSTHCAEIALRPSLEYFGTAAAESGPSAGSAHEILANLFLDLSSRWTVGVTAGKGLSTDPGVPVARVALSVQYRAPYRKSADTTTEVTGAVEQPSEPWRWSDPAAAPPAKETVPPVPLFGLPVAPPSASAGGS
jgi:hypothetical protein